MQPGLGIVVSDFAPSWPNILVNSDYEIITAMLESYDNNDFRFTALVPNSVFPAGALLGWPGTVAGGVQHALDAGGVVSDTTALLLYAWSIAGMALRGRLANQNIPACFYNHAVVLAKDVDLFDSADSTLDYLVPVFWRGSFKPTGVIQDTVSYAATPFPIDGVGRITIVPGNR